uniref:Glutathione peroxidase n=1 Tax=Strombidium rassoulzadegani TaxID=1082188 RepID=A0A7S3FY82_9SPIT|mmetsp:Transcript_5985/g.10176  ORF Transcript_5985/g.10176 Transcript_5985/m.10176 type:complete len:121 (+) Transcript_5985:216-578(+)
MVQIHSELKDSGFEILAFPCNQFGGQEPGSAQDIENFARGKYGAEFPISEKIEVNGKGTHPVYSFLRQKSELYNPKSKGTKVIAWNFAKFLVDGQTGKVVGFYGPQVQPLDIVPDIKARL